MNLSVDSFGAGAGGFVPPNPGGAQASGAAAAESAVAGQCTPTGSNPLVAAANPLLNLVPQIRSTVHHPNPAWLREHLVVEIRAFETRAQKAGVPPETIMAARYCLCTALDEAAALTPWGSGVWSSHSLLVSFHNETWGGEKFFEVLARLSQQPGQHIDLLELLQFCLALGFEGRYRVVDNGRAQLDALRRQLARTIRTARGDYDSSLSPHWRDAVARDEARGFAVPLWVCAVLAVLLALGLFAGLRFALAMHADRLFTAIDELHLPRLQASAAPRTVAPAPPRLAHFLQPEIDAGLVSVRDEADRSVVVLRGDGLFASGSTAVIDRYLPVLMRIADALNGTAGSVTVVGYTDNVPVHTLRFASNWDLSQERAEAVKRLLATRLADRGRLSAQGRGEMDPVAPNDTASGRARNRRVEITLMLAPTAGSAQPAAGTP